MPVFRAYFKVLRSALPSMLIYIGIFLGLTLLFSLSASPASSLDFTETKTPVAVINRDGDSPLVQGLVSYLAQTNQLRDYPDDLEELQDALFFRNVQYIAIIPDGFTHAMLQGGEAYLQKVVVPNAMTTQYVDIGIDKYLNTLRRYLQFGQPADWPVLLAQVEADLAVQTPVIMTGDVPPVARGSGFYFTYFAYTQLALVMLGVTSVMLAFNRADLQQRNGCAPFSRRLFNLQLAAGHGVFALGTWLLLMVSALVFYWGELQPTGLLGLLVANTMLYTLVCLSIGLLVGSVVKNHNAQTAAVNMLTLGTAFLTGVFFPQSMISPAVASFAKFLPSYWYVRANDAISAVEHVSKANLAPIQTAMLMQLGFAVAIFFVALLLSKERRVA